MQAAQERRGLLGEGAKEARERGRTGDRFEAEHFGDGRITLQPGHARELVRAGEDATHITPGDVGRRVSIGAGGIVRQILFQRGAELLWLEELRPDDQAAVSGQALIGARNAEGRRGVLGVNLEAHRLVRLVVRL